MNLLSFALRSGNKWHYPLLLTHRSTVFFSLWCETFVGCLIILLFVHHFLRFTISLTLSLSHFFCILCVRDIESLKIEYERMGRILFSLILLDFVYYIPFSVDNFHS